MKWGAWSFEDKGNETDQVCTSHCLVSLCLLVLPKNPFLLLLLPGFALMVKGRIPSRGHHRPLTLAPVYLSAVTLHSAQCCPLKAPPHLQFLLSPLIRSQATINLA